MFAPQGGIALPDAAENDGSINSIRTDGEAPPWAPCSGKLPAGIFWQTPAIDHGIKSPNVLTAAFIPPVEISLPPNPVSTPRKNLSKKFLH
jgi:hypothetical protein